MSTAPMIVSGIVVLFVLLALSRTLRIIPQGRTGIVERLGRYHRTLEPGMHILVPFIDRLLSPLADMREQTVVFPPQAVITEDNVTVNIDTVFYYRVTDAKASTYEVANLLMAVEQLTLTTLRNSIGSLNLDQALTSRDEVNQVLRTVLDEATQRWGIRVERVEIKAIDPPSSIQDAMEKQMRAERERRATILTAEGTKEALVLTAQGEKDAAILAAEADKTAQVLNAEGEKDAAVLIAEGEAKAIELVRDELGKDRDGAELYLRLQQLLQLPKVADGKSNTVFIPTDTLGGVADGARFGAGFELGSGAVNSPTRAPARAQLPPAPRGER